jgi:hypothetical protein
MSGHVLVHQRSRRFTYPQTLGFMIGDPPRIKYINIYIKHQFWDAFSTLPVTQVPLTSQHVRSPRPLNHLSWSLAGLASQPKGLDSSNSLGPAGLSPAKFAYSSPAIRKWMNIHDIYSYLDITLKLIS